MNVRQALKRAARSALVPVIYRYPPSVLAPERLYVLLHYLTQTKQVPGAVVEVGCNLGGTAVVAKQMLNGLGITKPYICIDTFDGFVGEQFERDVALGTPVENRHSFSSSSRSLVAKILHQHDCDDITLVQGDIVTIADDALPAQCSLVLADVDLTEPTYFTLKRLWPRLAPNGVLLVDDCAEGTNWKARIGYSRFCEEHGLAECYMHGMGIAVRHLDS